LALYTSFYLFAVGEVCPSNIVETAIAIIILIAAAIMNNVLLSLFSVYAEELSRKANMMQKKIDLTNTAM
jgi:hypothetical protein